MQIGLKQNPQIAPLRTKLTHMKTKLSQEENDVKKSSSAKAAHAPPKEARMLPWAEGPSTDLEVKLRRIKILEGLERHA